MGNKGFVGTCVDCDKQKELTLATGLCSSCTKKHQSDPQPKKENSNGS